MIDFKKVCLIQDLLKKVPSDSGRYWINVRLDVGSMTHGEITFGIDFKLEMGTIEFYSLDDAIVQVGKLLERMK